MVGGGPGRSQGGVGVVGGGRDADGGGPRLGHFRDGHLSAGGHGGIDGQFPLGQVVLQVV